MDIVELRKELYARREALIVYFRNQGIKEDAEDLASKVIIKAVEKAGTLRDHDKLDHWLNVIAANERKAFIKAKKRELKRRHPGTRRLESGEEVDLVADVADEMDVEKAFQKLDDARSVMRLLRTLPHPDRTIFLLHANEGRTFREIAESLDMNINTVKAIYSRGRKKLLNNYYEIFGEEAHHGRKEK